MVRLAMAMGSFEGGREEGKGTHISVRDRKPKMVVCSRHRVQDNKQCRETGADDDGNDGLPPRQAQRDERASSHIG